MENKGVQRKSVLLPSGRAILQGNLAIPHEAKGIVLFAHGSGSSRLSPRNLLVAKYLQSEGLATLLFDLLNHDEEDLDSRTMELRFDIGLLADRLAGATAWLDSREETRNLTVGYFGASTGAAAALIAAAERPDMIRAVVSRGGRPDLAGGTLSEVRAPTLFIVGGDDIQVLHLNEKSLAKINATKKLEIVPGATHLFEEAGALETVARLASEWFRRYLETDRV
jgi:putative phosphoribosyl transferase